MTEGLDVIVIDDDTVVCSVTSELIKKFYTWGDVQSFTDVDEALEACHNREFGVAIFVLDVFLGGKSGFLFLDSIAEKYPMAYEDTIIVTGFASDDIVNMCLASNICHLLEKPIRPYALQFAIRSIVAKYLNFAKKIMQDNAFAENIARLDMAT